MLDHAKIGSALADSAFSVHVMRLHSSCCDLNIAMARYRKAAKSAQI